MNNFKTHLFLLLTFAIVVGYSQDTLEVPYDPMIDDLVSIDGAVEEDEYPESFFDERTGMTVNWGCDDSLIYVGLVAPVTGWIAVGFGSLNRDSANIILGFTNDDTADCVNFLGVKEGLKQLPSEPEEWEIDEDNDTTTLEFSYPLVFSETAGMAIKRLEHGKVYKFILETNATKDDPKAKPTHWSSGYFYLASKEELKPEEKEEKKEEKK